VLKLKCSSIYVEVLKWSGLSVQVEVFKLSVEVFMLSVEVFDWSIWSVEVFKFVLKCPSWSAQIEVFKLKCWSIHFGVEIFMFKLSVEVLMMSAEVLNCSS
jgi:hypothetical protein